MIEQVGGTHYSQFKYQTWDFIADFEIDYFTGNAVKYISRYKDKNGNEDLLKAKSYILKIIEDKIHTPVIDINNEAVKSYLDQFDVSTRLLLKKVLTKDYVSLIGILDMICFV